MNDERLARREARLGALADLTDDELAFVAELYERNFGVEEAAAV